MINGFHAIIYTRDAVADRAFFKDVLGLKSVDAGDGWLIFALPPAELGVHPADADEAGRHQLFFMCDSIHETVRSLEARGVQFTSPIADQGWGLLTTVKLPGGGKLDLYEPRHPVAISVSN